jgi:hypothetical protein
MVSLDADPICAETITTRHYHNVRTRYTRTLSAPGFRRTRRAPVHTQDFKTVSLAAKLADMYVNASLIHGLWTMYYERFHGILSAEINRGISIEE